MSPFEYWRTVVLRLLVLAILAGMPSPLRAAPAPNSPPRLQNVSLTPVIGEHRFATLRAEIRDANLTDTFRLSISWGDGTLAQVIKYPARTRWITNSHLYYDDGQTNTASDIHVVNLRLNDSKGALFITNRQILVTNVEPQVALSVATSPDGSATERGLALTEFVVPTAASSPLGITVGPDSALWFTQSGAGKIGRITTDGVFQQFAVTNALGLGGIASGPDNRLYFCAFTDGKIGRITTNGIIKVFKIPRAVNAPPKLPLSITRGPNSTTMWFTMLGKGLGRISTTGVIGEVANLPANIINPYGIALGHDNNIWFTDWGNDLIARRAGSVVSTFPLTFLDTPRVITRGVDDAMWFTSHQNGYVGRIAADGQITRYPTGDYLPWGITAGPDGAMWFVEGRPAYCNIVRMYPNGSLRRFPLAVGADPREIVTGPDGALWFTLPGRNRIGRMQYTGSGNVVLHGQIIEPGFRDPHLVVINWGDNSPEEFFTLKPGIHTFNVAHTYPTGLEYPIQVMVTDDDTGAGIATIAVTP